MLKSSSQIDSYQQSTRIRYESMFSTVQLSSSVYRARYSSFKKSLLCSCRKNDVIQNLVRMLYLKIIWFKEEVICLNKWETVCMTQFIIIFWIHLVNAICMLSANSNHWKIFVWNSLQKRLFHFRYLKFITVLLIVFRYLCIWLHLHVATTVLEL